MALHRGISQVENDTLGVEGQDPYSELWAMGDFLKVFTRALTSIDQADSHLVLGARVSECLHGRLH